MKLASWRFGGVFGWSVAVIFVPMVIVVRQFEEARVFDSIGTWYTVIVASVFSALLGLGVAAVAVLFRVLRTRPRIEEH